MKIVIVGCGRVGRTIIKALSQEGHDITALDMREDVVKKLSGTHDLLAINENGINVESQREADVGNCDLLIAATSSDEKNILCCMTAKKLGAKRTVARVRNPEYNEHLKLLKEELGLSFAVNPEYVLADEMYRILRFPSAINLDSFAKGKVEIAEIAVPENSPLNGTALYQINNSFKTNFLVCAVEREGDLIIPDGKFSILAGDRIHVTASDDKLNEFFKEAGVYKGRPKKIMIAGGGHAAYHLCEKLHGIGIQIKIIEIDPEKANKIENELPYVSVVVGNAISAELLAEEGIENVDAFIALTDKDETNSILALYAQERGVNKVITKISHKLVGNIFDRIGLDSVVSTENLTANKIVTFVRSIASERGSGVLSIYKMFEGQGEAVEFIADKNCKLLNRPLKDIRTKPELIVASIEHEGKIILPTGGSVISEGDTVVIVAKHQYFDCLDDIADE